MKVQKLYLLFSLAFTFSLSAQGEYRFTLQQAIDHGLEYNYQMINTGRDIQAARKKKWETTAIGLPQINADIDYLNNIEIPKQAIPAEFFGGNPGEFTEVAFGIRHTMNARATLSQIIFDGSYLVALQASKTYLAFFENMKLKTAREIREMIVQSYGQVLLVEESISIFENNKKVLENNLREARETYANGLAEEETVEQIEITLASVQSALRNNQRLLKITTDMLKINLGLELQDNLILLDKLESLAIQHMDWAINAPEFQVQQNVDYALGQNNEEQKRLLLMQEKSASLPKLSANATFGYNAFNTRFEFFTPNQDWFNYSFVGVALQVPIFSSLMRSARTQQAKIEYEKSKTELTELEQRLMLQYKQARSEYDFSVEEYSTNKNSLRLAERIEQKQQIKFREGIASSFEFSEAQRQLYSAQQAYLQSMVNLINRKASLEKIVSK